ncbi:hypothetical protein SLA2020_122130 [Shorea laevis]
MMLSMYRKQSSSRSGKHRVHPNEPLAAPRPYPCHASPPHLPPCPRPRPVLSPRASRPALALLCTKSPHLLRPNLSSARIQEGDREIETKNKK